MNRKNAEQIRSHALVAISELSAIAQLSMEDCTIETREQIKKGVGLTIGEIQMSILEIIIQKYPDLDDLK